MILPRYLLPVCVLSLASVSRGAEGGADDFFEKAVRPLLVERCQKCHGDEGKPKGGLKLTSREAVLAGGDSGPAVVEGKPEESLLVQAIRYKDEPRMPPKEKLPDGEIETLAKWVAMGLPWPSAKTPAPAAAKAAPYVITDEQRRFWAFQPVRKTAPPAVKDASWPKNDIDRFLLAALEAKGIPPAPPADKRTLIRRASFDLTGLPPTPQEIDAFLKDDAPEAFARVVDRLLASPHYGERWARHWLDVVRYADSLDARGSGGEGDILDAWRYRDWVVAALNADMPYDRFVQMQIAGDLLPPSSPSEGSEGFNREGTIATTMLAIGNWGNGDADKEKILTDIADDQVDVVSKAFLGLTVSCARCHDHKFDPIPTKDYYGLAGIFFSTHILPKLTPKGAGETIIRVPLVSKADQERRTLYAARVAELEKAAGTVAEAEAAAFAKVLKPETARYLVALWDYQHRPADQSGVSIASFAESHGLLPFALRQWAEYFGSAANRPLDQKVAGIGGKEGVLAWLGTPDAASATANTTDNDQTIATFRLGRRSVAVHPGPASGAVVTWTSPIAGAVRIAGRLADADPAGGDGVLWFLDHVSPSGRRELASGDLANGGQQSTAQGKGGERLASVSLRPGDQLQLTVMPRAEYTCDTTTVELVVSSWDGPATWDLTRDLVADFHAGNPHPDRLGHAGVWRFEDTGTKDRPAALGAPEGSPQAVWSQAVASGDRAQVARAAEGFAAAFDLADRRSPFFVRNPADEPALPEPSRAALEKVRTELVALRKSPPPPILFANAAQDGGVPESPHAGTHDVRVHMRGRYDRLGELVPRHFPTIITGVPAEPIAQGSGRVELARWLTRPEHPLTPRVMVNRIWQHHFGEGIVRSPSNFGKLGDRPSHPELLDFLAAEFVASGWSVKAVHRAIMLSAAYRQSSAPTPEALKLDADNRLFSRMNRRRIEAEILRDNLLAVSGMLDPTPGGPAIRDFNIPRRGLYAITIRSDRSTFGALFDQADSTAPVDKRVVTTVAPQALYLLNNPFVTSQAGSFAKRLLREAPEGDRARIALAYALLFARPPAAEEEAIGLAALDAAKKAGDTPEAAWEAYGQILLSANEFLFID